MTTIYLSGPISLGDKASADEIVEFTKRFTIEADRLRKAGYRVINPCECPKETSWEAYMRHGMRAVANCDLIAVLPRWRESKGAILEAFVAHQLGIPIIDVEEI